MLGDIGLIERVLENIIDNAIRHTPSGGTITVSIIRRPASVLIQIADTGHGIAAKDLPHIFDRFYRGEYDRSRGGGLGLAITKRILELHGSSIRAESTPNVGTIMAFELPAVGP